MSGVRCHRVLQPVVLLGLALLATGCGVGPSGTESALSEQGGIVLVLVASPGPGETLTDDDVRSTGEFLRERIDALGVEPAELVVHSRGDSATFTVTLVGSQDIERARTLASPGVFDLRPVAAVDIAAVDAASTPSLTPPLQVDADSATLRAALGSADCTGTGAGGRGAAQDPTRWLVACSTDGLLVYILEPAVVLGADVTAARVIVGAGGAASVEVMLNPGGAQALAEMSSRLAAGQPPTNQLAAVLDSEVVSAPSIAQPILGGSLIVDGGFTRAQADVLAAAFAHGGLPVPVRVAELRVVPAP